MGFGFVALFPTGLTAKINEASTGYYPIINKIMGAKDKKAEGHKV